MREDRQYEHQALDALNKAVADALERMRRLGQRPVVWQGGRMVQLEAGELGRGCSTAAEREPSGSTGQEPEPKNHSSDGKKR